MVVVCSVVCTCFLGFIIFCEEGRCSEATSQKEMGDEIKGCRGRGN